MPLVEDLIVRPYTLSVKIIKSSDSKTSEYVAAFFLIGGGLAFGLCIGGSGIADLSHSAEWLNLGLDSSAKAYSCAILGPIGGLFSIAIGIYFLCEKIAPSSKPVDLDLTNSEEQTTSDGELLTEEAQVGFTKLIIGGGGEYDPLDETTINASGVGVEGVDDKRQVEEQWKELLKNQELDESGG